MAYPAGKAGKKSNLEAATRMIFKSLSWKLRPCILIYIYGKKKKLPTPKQCYYIIASVTKWTIFTEPWD